MLYTIKQMKGIFNFELGFSSVEGGSSSVNFSDTMSKSQNIIDDKWIKDNKDNIVKWINEKKGTEDSISLNDLENTESWNNLVSIMTKIGVIKGTNNSFDVKSTLEKINSFSADKDVVTNLTQAERSALMEEISSLDKDKKGEMSSLQSEENLKIKDEVSNQKKDIIEKSSETKKKDKKGEMSSLQSEENLKIKDEVSNQKKDIIEKSSETQDKKEVKDLDIIKSFDTSKYDSKRSYPEVKRLQQELNKRGANLKDDGILGVNTKKALENIRNPKTSSSSESQTIIESQTNYTKEEAKSLVDNFNINSKNKEENKKFQKALNTLGASLVVDGIIGKNTKISYNLYREGYENLTPNGQKNTIIESQITKDSANKTDTPLEAEDKTLKETRGQIEKTGKTMDDMSARLEMTKELNDNLSRYYSAGNRGYSIEAGVRRLFGDDKVKHIVSEKNQYEAILSNPAMKTRLENALGEVMWIELSNVRINNGDEHENDRREAQKKGELRGKFLKIAPWIFGIYLGDIPISIGQKMLSGADVNKTQAFNSWIKSGMKEEFKDYLKINKTEDLTPIKDQITLKDFLSRTNLTNEEQAKILSGDLNGLSERTKSLLLKYLEVNLIPNLEIMYKASFNSFERARWFTLGGFFGLFRDKKHREVKDIIDGLKVAVANKKLDNSTEISRAFKLLAEEGDISQNILDKSEAGQNYINRISGNDKELQRQFNGLAKLGQEKYNTYNRLFALKNLNDIYNLGVSASDKKAISDLENILNKDVIDGQALDKWERINPNALNFVKSLGNPELMKKYQISSIPKESNLRQLRKNEIERDTNFNDTHGVKLDGIDNAKDLQIAKTTSVDAASGISTLGYAYKSFVEKAGLVGISYQEFENAFANKQKIDINSLDSEAKIINTNRNSDGRIGKVTNFAELAKKRGDTHVFKLNLDKEYTYYEDGKEVTVKAKYDLYLRQDCTNPLIVPNTVSIKKEGREIPEGEFASLTSMKGKIPIVAPWPLFLKGGVPTTSASEVKTTPGFDVRPR